MSREQQTSVPPSSSTWAPSAPSPPTASPNASRSSASNQARGVVGRVGRGTGGVPAGSRPTPRRRTQPDRRPGGPAARTRRAGTNPRRAGPATPGPRPHHEGPSAALRLRSRRPIRGQRADLRTQRHPTRRTHAGTTPPQRTTPARLKAFPANGCPPLGMTEARPLNVGGRSGSADTADPASNAGAGGPGQGFHTFPAGAGAPASGCDGAGQTGRADAPRVTGCHRPLRTAQAARRVRSSHAKTAVPVTGWP